MPGFSTVFNGLYLTVEMDDGRRYFVEIDESSGGMRTVTRAYRGRSGWINRAVAAGTGEWDQVREAFDWWRNQPT